LTTTATVISSALDAASAFPDEFPDHLSISNARAVTRAARPRRQQFREMKATRSDSAPSG